jgi:hypothetical protein
MSLRKEGCITTIITGVVTNGISAPNSPLPEGAPVEIHVNNILEIPAELKEDLAAWKR